MSNTYGKPIPDDWDGSSYAGFSGRCPDSPLWKSYVLGAISRIVQGWDIETGDVIEAEAEAWKVFNSLEIGDLGVMKKCVGVVTPHQVYKTEHGYIFAVDPVVNDPFGLVSVLPGEIYLVKSGWYFVDFSLVVRTVDIPASGFIDYRIDQNGVSRARAYSNLNDGQWNVVCSGGYFEGQAGDLIHLVIRTGADKIEVRAGASFGFAVALTYFGE